MCLLHPPLIATLLVMRHAQPRSEDSLISKSLQQRYAPNSRCFGCGPKNEHGLRINSVVDGDALVCSFTPQIHHQAFDGVLNGGIVGALLDCHSNWAAAYRLMQVQGLDEPPCTVTADFHVTLKRPTPTTTGPLELRARVIEVQGRDKAVVEATLTALMPSGERKITSTCLGSFVAVKEGHPAFHRW